MRQLLDDFAVSARNKIVSSELYNGVMIKIDHEMMQRTANENAARKRRTVCVCPQLPYRGNDMMFWIFPIVPCHAFCM